MRQRRPGVVGPLILITAGVLLLLANMGLLPLSFWEILARFWPLILILVGLEIIVGRYSIIGSLVVIILWIAMVAGAIWLASPQGSAYLPAAPPAAVDQLSQPLGDIKSASVSLKLGVSSAFVSALGTDTASLMEGTYSHAAGSSYRKDYNVIGSEGRLTLQEAGTAWVFWGLSRNRWDLKLNPDVPIALTVNGGIGTANLDLSNLSLTSLSVDSGLGTMSITTPKTGSTTMHLSGGIGSATITIPNGVAASIHVSGGLGAFSINQARFPSFGDVYQSADYARATNKISIEVNGGLGSINVR